MDVPENIKKALSEHPCFCEDAHHSFARMHLPVAPRCNIQCNYCNRKFDCSNESRPGVTSVVLEPQQALQKVKAVKEAIPQLSVIGIAGPGDPLANEATFESLELIGKEMPGLTLCVSTNGLALPDCAQRLYDLGVRFVTVTMNCMDPEIGAKIYDAVVFDGKKYSSVEGAEILRNRQIDGIKKCVALGMLVKINIVMIPDINDSHIPDLVAYVRSLGIYMVNILPLIPVEGTKFSDLRAPTPLERRDMMDRCGLDGRMMRHCRQCRADAIGLLGQDRSAEFANIEGCGLKDRRINVTFETEHDESKVAVATSDGKNVNSGFGNASEFRIYATDGNTVRFLKTVAVDRSGSVAGKDHRDHIESIIRQLEDCGTVIVEEIGPMPSRILSELGVRVVITQGDVNEAVRKSKE
ncbi:MAG: nitrogenase cofactor biosynthesis protein NifB [Candidatus Methanomethylophilaceae archaeon]|nr:nitrogenase cofactor biosynthesis protein NifB [Candidatus Methanomethylophilaceae archaeon]